MSDPTSPTSDTAVLTRPDRSERHARQGGDAARRLFAETIIPGCNDEECVARVDVVVDRVEQGPAPAAFKSAFVATMSDLLTEKFGA